MSHSPSSAVPPARWWQSLILAILYKLTIDGQELVEIDAVNLVRKVGGTDQMDAIRAAIGV